MQEQINKLNLIKAEIEAFLPVLDSFIPILEAQPETANITEIYNELENKNSLRAVKTILKRIQDYQYVTGFNRTNQ